MPRVPRLAQEENGVSTILIISLIGGIVIVGFVTYIFLVGGNKPPSSSFTAGGMRLD